MIAMQKVWKTLTIWLAVLVLIGAAVAIGITVFLFQGVFDNEVDSQSVDMYTFQQKAGLEQLLEDNNMSHNPAHNTVEQYESIKQHLKEEDMIIYYDFLGITEVKKICQVFGYEDLNDFLLKKNYVDEDGKPSISHMRTAAEIYMTEVMRQRN